MRKATILIIALLAAVPALRGQESYGELLGRIAGRSLSFEAARRSFTADSLKMRRGLNPSDPTVALDYFINSGTSFEMRIEQSFDFPTVYHNRNKVSKLGISRAADDLHARRREIMIEASDFYLAMAYNGALVGLLEQRTANLKEVLDLSRKAMEQGDKTILDIMQADNMYAESCSMLIMARSEYDRSAAELAALNGGGRIGVAPGAYPVFGFNGSRDEFVAAAMAGDYALKAAETDSLIAVRNLKLSRSEWLPQLVAGYRLDLDGGSSRHAVAAGISLPLWQNRGNVKHAKAMITAAQASKAEAVSRTKVRLENLYNRYLAAEEALNGYGENKEYPRYLKRTADEGAITAIEYVLALIGWYETEQSRQEMEYLRAQAAAEISIYLTD